MSFPCRKKEERKLSNARARNIVFLFKTYYKYILQHILFVMKIFHACGENISWVVVKIFHACGENFSWVVVNIKKTWNTNPGFTYEFFE